MRSKAKVKKYICFPRDLDSKRFKILARDVISLALELSKKLKVDDGQAMYLIEGMSKEIHLKMVGFYGHDSKRQILRVIDTFKRRSSAKVCWFCGHKWSGKRKTCPICLQRQK